MEVSVHYILQKAAEMQKKHVSFVLATVVQGTEGSPGRTGFKLISFENGRFEGTIGGGELERLVLDKCKEIHKTHKNSLIKFNLTESEKGIGMQCGGEVSIFLEYYPSSKKAFLFGAGHLCRSMTPILKSLDFHTIVIDNRAEFANKDKIPAADDFFVMEYEDFSETFMPSKNDAILIFTHGHKHDFIILDTICKKNPNVKYIGMIGSKVKVAQAVEKIRQKNYQGKLIEKIYAPIGLNIGKTTTQEISIAIAAEILAVYNDIQNIDFLSRLNKKRDAD